MVHESTLTLLVGLLVMLSGCAAFGIADSTPPQQTSPRPPTTTATVTATATTTPTATATPTTTANTGGQLTDRSPDVWLELFPQPGFTGRVQVRQDDEQIFDESFEEYSGFDGIEFTDESDDTGHTITVAVNGTVEWERRIGPTERFELDVLQNGTVEVRRHTIR